MRETKYWTWHMLAGLVILVLLGMHMITMHLSTILGWFNPAGPESTDWANVVARGKLIAYAVIYVVLLGVALYHGLYGFRTIIFELGPSKGTQHLINVIFFIVGLGLFIMGSWAAIKFHAIAQAV